MVEYLCKKCQFTTKNKAHYKRHCKTIKHQKNNSETIRVGGEDIIYDFMVCKEKLKIFESEMSKKDDLIRNLTHKLSKSSSNTINSNNKTINKNIHKYIINNICPPSNVIIELDKPVTNEEIKWIKERSPLDAIYFFIHNRLIKDKKKIDRTLICYDLSRKKYCFFGEDNKWIDDIGLITFKKMIFNKLSKIYNAMHQADPNATNDAIETQINKWLTTFNEFRDILGTSDNRILKKLYPHICTSEKIINQHKDNSTSIE